MAVADQQKITLGETAGKKHAADANYAPIIIVGSGLSGLGTAIQLLKRGRKDFLIMEKAKDIGGTWRDNTYPGCVCDVPTALYSFSFEQNPYWSRLWCGQPEIQAYLQKVAAKYNLREKTLFNTNITSAHWDETTARWRLQAENGRNFSCQFLFYSIAPLHVPNIPHIPGIDSFEGPVFHSAQWDHSTDLNGKNIAVIGTGASAVQIVPAIVDRVKHLQLYQRTPAWILGRPDPSIPKCVQKLFAATPWTLALFRFIIYCLLEIVGLSFYRSGRLNRILRWFCEQNIKRGVKYNELRKKLTPNYPPGCKRVLFSSKYYPTLARTNVDVISETISEIRQRSIVTSDGVERKTDVIVYATGFNIYEKNLDIRGDETYETNLENELRGDVMYTGLHGVVKAGLPNIFFLMGPNTGVAYSSILFMIEQQISYALLVLEAVRSHDATTFRVQKKSQEKYNEQLRRMSENRVWMKGGCTNWFVDETGTNRALWPGFTWEYRRSVRQIKESELEFSK